MTTQKASTAILYIVTLRIRPWVCDILTWSTACSIGLEYWFIMALWLSELVAAHSKNNSQLVNWLVAPGGDVIFLGT